MVEEWKGKNNQELRIKKNRSNVQTMHKTNPWIYKTTFPASHSVKQGIIKALLVFGN
jgi:hypothetical protein